MKLHSYHQALIDAYRQANRPFFHQLSPADAREMLRAGIAAAPKPTDLPELSKAEDFSIDGPNGAIPLRLYHPLGAAVGTCVFLHGGGWVIGDLDQTDATCRRLAGKSNCLIVSVDYRLAPEHPFPQPLDDCWRALNWSAENCPGPLIVSGESAGGNLAAACAIRARDAAAPSLAGQLLIYPVTDHDFETGSYQQIGGLNWLLSTEDMKWFWDHYCPVGVDRTQPELSPLRLSDTSGLAPAMIAVGEFDPLRNEALAYARQLAECGVSVSFRCDAQMLHGYFAAAESIPAAGEALADAAHWIRARMAAAKA